MSNLRNVFALQNALAKIIDWPPMCSAAALGEGAVACGSTGQRWFVHDGEWHRLVDSGYRWVGPSPMHDLMKTDLADGTRAVAPEGVWEFRDSKWHRVDK